MSASPERRDRFLLLLILLVVLVLVPGILMMGFWGGTMGPGFMGSAWGGWIGMGFGLVLLVVLVVILLGASGSLRGAPAVPPFPPPPPMDALTILDARYARGEISRDEYLRIRADLEHRAA